MASGHLIGGGEWPRGYTPAEIEAIARSLGRKKLGPTVVAMLQESLERYQWASLVDEGIISSSTRKCRRQQLTQILDHIKQNAPDGIIEQVLGQLDGPTSQRLGPVGINDRRLLARAVWRAIKEIPDQGPDPQRARRQLIDELYPIFHRVRGRRPGRIVHDGETGAFLEFVKAALSPFKDTMGCEADIKIVLHQRANRRGGRKT